MRKNFSRTYTVVLEIELYDDSIKNIGKPQPKTIGDALDYIDAELGWARDSMGVTIESIKPLKKKENKHANPKTN